MERNQYKIRSRAGRQSSKFVVGKRRRNFLQGSLILITIAVWLFVFARFSNLPALTIEDITINGASADISGQLQIAALGAIQGNYLQMFSKANAYIYSKSAVKKAVLAASPRIQSVTVEKSDNHTLNINVNEKVPAALVCATLPDFSNADEVDSGVANSGDLSNNCEFADHNGKLYMQAPIFSTQVYNRYYYPDLVLDSSSTDATSTNDLSADKFAILQKFYDNLRAARITPLGILVKGGGEYELYVNNPTLGTTSNSSASSTDTVVIYFNEHNGFENELGNLISFWNHTIDVARSKNASTSFDSIDLRYGSNVFYRNAQ